jgi:hypothetical protein
VNDAGPERIVLTRLWPATGRARTHVGLGVPLIGLVGGFGIPLLCLVVLPLLIAAQQTLLIVAVVVVAITANRMMVRARQFYAVDDAGRPVRVIGPEQPERIRGRRGMSRRRFLATR